MSKYLVNNTHAKISLLNDSIKFGIGEHAAISDEVAQHQEVLDAIARGWVNLIDSEPEAAEKFEPKYDIQNAKPQGTLEFPGKQAPAPESVVTGTKLGGEVVTPAVEESKVALEAPVPAEPVVEPVVEPVAEEVVKKSKKAA